MPTTFAPYSGLASFCDRYETFLLDFDGADNMPRSTADLEGARTAWLAIGFPDELVGEARSVDDLMELLVNESSGVDLSDPSRANDWAFELAEDPGNEALFDRSNNAYEYIRSYANDNCT